MSYILINEPGKEIITDDFEVVKKLIQEEIKGTPLAALQNETISINGYLEDRKEDLSALNELSGNTIIGKIDETGQISYI